MRISAEIHKPERVHRLPAESGNWMHMTIAPLVAEKLVSDEPLPGAGAKSKELRSVVGAAGGASLADDDSVEPGE